VQYLATFDFENCKTWIYEGWAENRTCKEGDKGYDPQQPNKKKHQETEYFLYYSLIINGKKYWANVKRHINLKADVLYTIEQKKPEDLIPGIHP